MPKTRGLVELAPVDRPPTKPVDRPPAKPAPLKRSTSLVSLPTPPRTLSKRKRARSRVTDSDSEEDEYVARHGARDEDSAGRRDANGALVLGNKKRKTLDAIAEELSEAKAEEAFWMGETASSALPQDRPRPQPKSHYRVRARSRTRTRSPSSSPPPAPHLLRRGHTGLASPPPSRRQPRTRVRERPATPPPPVPARTRKPGLFPARDSPDNPFLADDTPKAVSDTEPVGVPEPRTPEPLLEKPTITWVFRGTRVQLANPHYKSPGAPDDNDTDTDEQSVLPVEHPDYSPPPTFVPRLLFPEARARDLPGRKGRHQSPVEPTEEPTRSQSTPATPKPAAEERTESSQRSRPASAASHRSDKTPLKQNPGARASSKEVEAAMEAALAQRLARRLASSRPVVDSEGAPQTRTRARGAPRLPDRDSDPARRAMGPVRAADARDRPI